MADVGRIDSDVMSRFRAIDPSDVAGRVSRALDVLGIVGGIPASTLAPIVPGRSVIGQAFTIRNIPERMCPYRSWSEAAPSGMHEREAFFSLRGGDVVVIDGSSVGVASCLGSMAAELAGSLGASGVIVSGMVTGVPGVAACGLPVWARGGTTVTGHHRVETVEVNRAIGIEGVRVEPGDLVVADDSGIAVVPRGAVRETIEVVERMANGGVHLRKLMRTKSDRDALRAALGEFFESYVLAAQWSERPSQ